MQDHDKFTSQDHQSLGKPTSVQVKNARCDAIDHHVHHRMALPLSWLMRAVICRQDDEGMMGSAVQCKDLLQLSRRVEIQALWSYTTFWSENPLLSELYVSWDLFFSVVLSAITLFLQKYSLFRVMIEITYLWSENPLFFRSHFSFWNENPFFSESFKKGFLL